MTPPIVVVLKGYPRLSETFIAEEIRGLERAGLDIRIVALRRPTDGAIHPVHREIAAPVAYLPEYLHHAPLRVLRAWLGQRRTPGYGAARVAFLEDLRRDTSRNRLRRFGQALVLAAEMPAGVERMHAHFIHTPASVVRYASLLTGLPWSCSAHAKDIWTTPDWELAEKLHEATWTVTCTRAGCDRLATLSPAGKPVHLVYHGLRLDRFVPLQALGSRRDGAAAADPVRILTVGRAVDKKGVDLLVRALAGLPRDLAWRLTHVGGGPELGRLKALAGAKGIAERIEWLGARDQTQVLAQYRRADLFALPCRVAADGDRDGLPNVIVEAQSQGLACVSTRVGGVPELIEHGTNGLLVAPEDPEALAAAIVALMRDPDLRRRLGRAGAARVRRDFDCETAAQALVGLLRGEDPGPASSAAAE
ncbi:MAG TPA: glycosyltransferase family 4 protein [Lichenihabitans sp.]|nr:glycosyltransferase family 4 protein [Lichenihabitans sp.]